MIALFLTALLAQSYYSPTEAQALFSQANDAYYREDYATAKDDYLKLVNHGFGGTDVLFNLGTACLASGDVGEAVLYLERARRLGGKAEDVDANLAVARSRQLDQVVGGVAEEPFLQRLVDATPVNAIGWGFLASWIGIFALLLVFRFLPRGRRAWSLILAGLCGLIAIPTGALLAAHVWVRETMVDGVVLAKTLPARDLPKDNAKVSFEVHAGLKVRMLEQDGAFVKIRLPNGLEGWTQKDGVAEI